MGDYEYQLKFVVTAPEDLAEIEAILKETNADRSRVLLMPEGISSETIHERVPLAGGPLQTAAVPLQPAAAHRPVE